MSAEIFAGSHGTCTVTKRSQSLQETSSRPSVVDTCHAQPIRVVSDRKDSQRIKTGCGRRRLAVPPSQRTETREDDAARAPGRQCEGGGDGAVKTSGAMLYLQERRSQPKKADDRDIAIP